MTLAETSPRLTSRGNSGDQKMACALTKAMPGRRPRPGVKASRWCQHALSHVVSKVGQAASRRRRRIVAATSPWSPAGLGDVSPVADKISLRDVAWNEISESLLGTDWTTVTPLWQYKPKCESYMCMYSQSIFSLETSTGSVDTHQRRRMQAFTSRATCTCTQHS